MTTNFDTLRGEIVPIPKDYDYVASVTVSYKVEDDFGELSAIPSATGRLTSVTFSVEYESLNFSTITEEAVRRVELLIEAGLFASKDSAEEFPGIEPSELHFSIDVAL